MIGNVYNMPPQPPEDDKTTYLEAGAVTFGVEYRVLDPEMLRQTYKDNPEQLRELEERSPEGGFYAEGVSLHVVGNDGHEYLRFDMFDSPPHYHYNHPSDGVSFTNNVIDYDAAANGPMLDWALARMRSRLPDMLREAGGGAVADQVDPAVVDKVLDEVESLAAAAGSPAPTR
jgi:hypothetical protein